MKDLVICVPSKGRPLNVIFRHLQLIDPEKVYVYVHSPEYKLYAQMYPQWHIVAHDKSNIGEIRNFIQEHQHGLDNAYLSLDDDVWGFLDRDEQFQTDLATLYEEIMQSFASNEYDIIDLHFKSNMYKHKREAYDDPLSLDKFINVTDFTAEPSMYEKSLSLPDIKGMSAVAYAIAPSLWDKGVRFSTDARESEDFDMTIQLILNKGSVRRIRLPYIALFNYNDSESNFGTPWYTCCLMRLYAKYGNIFDIELHLDTLQCHVFHEELLKDYKARGNKPLYSPLLTKWLELYTPQTTDEKLAKQEALEVILGGKELARERQFVRNEKDKLSTEALLKAGFFEGADIAVAEEAINLYKGSLKEAPIEGVPNELL